MSGLQRLLSIVSLALLAAPAAAQAAPAPRGPVETVRSYVKALKAKDVERACAMLDPSYWGDGAAGCRDSLRAEPLGSELARVRIEPGALARGARARVLVDLVVVGRSVAPWAARARVLLRHVGGRWRIRQSGPLPGIGRRRPDRVPSDVAPAAGASVGAALRRLADDELLAVSGNEWMLCDLLAPGAPLARGGGDGGCLSAGIYGSADALSYDVRADRVTIHRTGRDRARLEVALTIREAVRTAARPGWRMRTHRRTDTQYAVRVAGRWRLAKPSRWAYTLLDIERPDDVDAPTGAATWPYSDVPSLSEHPVPAKCRRPFKAMGERCPIVVGLAAGGGLVAWIWSDAWRVLARPVAAGRVTGPVNAVSSPSFGRAARHYWVPDAVAPVADGALVIERDIASPTRTVRAVPVGPDGRRRGDAQLLGGDDTGREQPARVVPGPQGAAVATVMLGSGRMVRVGADGRRVGADAIVAGLSDDARLLTRSDGTLLEVDEASGLEIRTRTADGSPVGTIATQAWLAGTGTIEPPAVAHAADGRVLVAWMESDSRGRGTVRVWVLDPSAPSATAPVAMSIPRAHHFEDGSGPDGDPVVVDALPGGGWGIAWRWVPKGGATELWAARLDAAGAPVGAPRRIRDRLGGFALGDTAFGLVGDTVAFVEWPAVAGLPQVRAAPLP